MRFIVHAGVWDAVALLLLGGFVVVYFVLWGLTAIQSRRKARR